MNEPETDAEKIEWLWKRLDQLNAENESLKAQAHSFEVAAEAHRDEAERVRESNRQMASELLVMARELNEARQSAVNAVREYVAAGG
jgi:uncharacterized coiled-coil DUF342 family protein